MNDTQQTNATNQNSSSECLANNNASRNPDLESYFMKQALHVAKSALDIGEVPVGCVIVLRNVNVASSSSSSLDDDVQIISSNPTTSGKCNTDETKAANYNEYSSCPNSVIVSHGANQVNATRDATRHAEIVAMDRMLTMGRSSDGLKLPLGVICKSAHGKVPSAYAKADDEGGTDDNNNKYDDDRWVNVSGCKDHWKNSFGWGSGRVYNKEIFSKCDLYVTCEPCIMCAAALSMVGINRVFFGCKNNRFGGCGSLLHLHDPDALPSYKHHGFEIHGGILEEEAIRLLQSFYDRENFHAPDDKRKRKPGTDDSEE